MSPESNGSADPTFDGVAAEAVLRPALQGDPVPPALHRL